MYESANHLEEKWPCIRFQQLPGPIVIATTSSKIVVEHVILALFDQQLPYWQYGYKELGTEMAVFSLKNRLIL
jgi:hypothetical protein